MSEENPEAMVPSARLREESAAKRAALAKVSELEAQVAELGKRAATVDTLTQQVTEWQTRHTTAAQAWESERSIYQIGVTDPEAIEVARMLHGKLPEDKRPPIGDWLREAKSDPSKAPKALQPYLSTQATPPPPAAPPPPSAPAGKAPASPPASSQTQMSADQIKALREQCQRTGDWRPWLDAQAAMR